MSGRLEIENELARFEHKHLAPGIVPTEAELEHHRAELERLERLERWQAIPEPRR